MLLRLITLIFFIILVNAQAEENSEEDADIRTPEEIEAEEKKQKEYLEKWSKLVDVDPKFGPLHYKPYAGGSRFEVQTITKKPGFKIWVDGGVMTYSDDVCIAKWLDCSETCCLQSYCAPTKSKCLYYQRRDYNELYVGFIVVLMIVVGIPTCIGTIEFLLNYKFCKKYDDEADAKLGGMTICEGLFNCLTCGKSMRA